MPDNLKNKLLQSNRLPRAVCIERFSGTKLTGKAAHARQALKFIRKLEVAKLVGWHPSHLMRMAKSGKFPKPVALGPNSTAFVESEVQDWMEARIADRNKSCGSESDDED